MTEFVVIDAPAKVNLTLHVVGKRADSYHILDSLVVFAGIGDRVACAPAEVLSLEIDGPHAGDLQAGDLQADNDNNIVLKAARLLAEWAGIKPQAHIRLTKILPVSSGIGGGSADAAAALRGLAQVWNLAPSEAELAQIGLKLGADVPVCLRGRPTLMGGIGDVLTDAPALPPAWLVLVNPRIGLSTPAVFKARPPVFSAPRPFDQAPPDVAALAQELAGRANDLTLPAQMLCPAIAAVLTAIGAEPSCLLARMSGSGATCFGLFAGRDAAQQAADNLSAAHPQWWVAAAPILE